MKWIRLYLADRADNWEPLFVSTGRSRDSDELGLGTSGALGEKRRLTAYTIQENVRRAARMAGIGKKLRRTLFDIHSRQIFYTTAPTFALFKKCSATPQSRPRKFTHTQQTLGCEKCTRGFISRLGFCP